MRKVNRHTRAGADGKIIATPCCGERKLIYHFSWSALMCNHCGLEIPKNDFDMVAQRWLK